MGDVTLITVTTTVVTRIETWVEPDGFTDRLEELLKRRRSRVEQDIMQEFERGFFFMMVRLAKDHPVPGYESDDLIQEMRVEAWEIIRKGKYDPARAKPSTFFYRVFYNRLYEINRNRLRNCRIDSLDFSDSLDLEESGQDRDHRLGRHDRRVFCDLCARIVDPHSNWEVFRRREYDPTLVCESCQLEGRIERLRVPLGNE